MPQYTHMQVRVAVKFLEISSMGAMEEVQGRGDGEKFKDSSGSVMVNIQ